MNWISRRTSTSFVTVSQLHLLLTIESTEYFLAMNGYLSYAI